MGHAGLKRGRGWPKTPSVRDRSPTDMLQGEALGHWLALGLDGAADRLSLRLGGRVKIGLEPPQAGPTGGSCGWAQDFEGSVRGHAALTFDPQMWGHWLEALVRGSWGGVEPSREVGEEAANVVLNGVLTGLSRAMGLRLRSGLPGPLEPKRGDLTVVCQRQLAFRWPDATVRAGLVLSVRNEDRTPFGQALRRSLPAFMESLAWST